MSDNLLALITDNRLCKLELFSVVFTPQLSMNLLILSLIDRYACTCSLTSPMRHLRPLKMVPRLIGVMSLYSPLLYDIIPGYGCSPTDPFLNGMLYIIIHGLMTPLVMLIFVWLTYRNIEKSRQRVVNILLLFFFLCEKYVFDLLRVFRQPKILSINLLEWYLHKLL